MGKTKQMRTKSKPPTMTATEMACFFQTAYEAVCEKIKENELELVRHAHYAGQPNAIPFTFDGATDCKRAVDSANKSLAWLRKADALCRVALEEINQKSAGEFAASFKNWFEDQNVTGNLSGNSVMGCDFGPVCSVSCSEAQWSRRLHLVRA